MNTQANCPKLSFALKELIFCWCGLVMSEFHSSLCVTFCWGSYIATVGERETTSMQDGGKPLQNKIPLGVYFNNS